MTKRKGMAASISVFLVLAAIIGTGFVMNGDDVFSSWGDNPEPENDRNPDQENQSSEPVSEDFVKVNWDSNACSTCYKLPMNVLAPVSSDLQAIIYKDGAHEDGEFGNYVGFNATKSVKGMTQGVNYFEQIGTGVTQLQFPRTSSLTGGSSYDIAIVDTAGTKEYHPLFTEFSTPNKVLYGNYKDKSPMTIIDQSQFTRTAAYDTDSAEVAKVNGDDPSVSEMDGDTDLGTSIWDSGSDNTVVVERTLSYTHGADLLGEVSVSNINSSVNEATLTVTASNHDTALYDQKVADNGAKVQGLNTEIPDLADDESMEKNPDTARGTVTARLELEFDGSTQSADAGLITFDVLDVFGSSIGTSGSTALTS